MMADAELEPVEVTVRFDVDGHIHPLQFSWLGTQIAVASSGRRWTDGIELHILVMDHQALVYELIFSHVEFRWFLRKTRQTKKNSLPT
jgi:hypothetical protein